MLITLNQWFFVYSFESPTLADCLTAFKNELESVTSEDFRLGVLPKVKVVSEIVCK